MRLYLWKEKHLYECLITCQSEKQLFWNWTIILGIFYVHELCFCKQRETIVWVFNNMSEKKHIWTRIIGIFTFINFSLKTFINKKHSLRSNCACLSIIYVCCEKSMLGYSALFLNLSSSGNIFFRLMPNGDCLLRSTSLSWVEDNSLKLMAGVKLLLNATYYAQYPAFKSVYEKSQYVIDIKLFSSYRAVFELA